MFEIKENLTTDNILLRISEYDIFKAYCKNFIKIGIHFNSELRIDPNPSAIISFFNGKLWYKDFGESEKPADCFSYVMRKYSITFLESLGVINNDFNLGLRALNTPVPSLNLIGLPDIHIISKLSEKEDTIIEVDERKWLDVDLKYWKTKYYLNIPRLEYFDIKPIRKVYINNKEISVDLNTYAFLVDLDHGVRRYKIYSPYRKKNKWVSNCKAEHYQGFNQLPWTHKNLVITKSLKDVGVLSLFKLPAIGPQSESQVVSYKMMEGLKKRFDNIYLFFDNDVAGRKGSLRNKEEHNLPEIFIPNEFKVKDISDFIDRYRYKETANLLNKLFK
jgi:hypothetical protein